MPRITVETPFGNTIVFSRKATEAIRQAASVQGALECPIEAKRIAESTIQQAALTAVLTGKTKVTSDNPLIGGALDSASTLADEHYRKTFTQTDGKRIIGVGCKNPSQPNPHLERSYSLTGEGASRIDLDKKEARRGIKKIAGQAYAQVLETVVGLPQEMIGPQVSTYIDNRASAVAESPSAIPQILQDAIKFRDRLTKTVSVSSQGTLNPQQELVLH